MRRIALLMCVLLLCAFAGCNKEVGNPTNQQTPIIEKNDNSQKLKEDAVSTVRQFLEAYTAKDTAALQYLTINAMDNSAITFEGYQGICASRMTYDIVEQNVVDETTVAVTVNIENIDILAVLKNLEKENLVDEQQILSRFDEMLTAEDVPVKTYSCNVVCKQYEMVMKIRYDANLSNALLGGLSETVMMTEG